MPGERREEDREQEQDAGDDRGEAGPAALGDAGGALDVGRVRARRPPRPPTAAATESTSRTRPMPGTDAVLVREAGLGGDAGDRAHRVEEVGEHDREDRQDRRQNGRAWRRPLVEVELAERREARAWRRACAGTFVTPATSAMIVVTRMLDDQRRADFRAYSTIVMARPSEEARTGRASSGRHGTERTGAAAGRRRR